LSLQAEGKKLEFKIKEKRRLPWERKKDRETSGENGISKRRPAKLMRGTKSAWGGLWKGQGLRSAGNGMEEKEDKI